MIYPSFVDNLNKLFGPDNIGEISVGDLPGWDVSLEDALGMMGVPSEGVLELLKGIPESHLFALRGLLESAVARSVPLNFAWLPAYDSKMTVCEWADEPGSPCGITIVIETRHHSDQRAGMQAS